MVDAATFVGLARRGDGDPRRPGTRRRAATQREETAGFSVWRDPLLRTLILGVCALVLAGEMTNVVEVFLVRGTLGASTLAFGLVGAALAVGVVVGSILAGRNVPDATRGPRTALAALALGLTIVLAGLSPGDLGLRRRLGACSASPTASRTSTRARCC